MSAALAAEDVSVRYGGVEALAHVSFTLAAGEAVGLIGPNGSGKSTLVDVLSGFLAPDTGRVRLRGRDVTRMEVERRTRAGVARTFQRLAGFGRLTVAEHYRVALAGAFRPRAELARLGEALLRESGVDVDAPAPVSTLPAAARRLLDVARALWTGPEVLLLDEPFAGLDERQGTALVRSLGACRRYGVTLLVVEHRLAELFTLVGRLLVLDGGRLIADGPAGEVAVRDDVVRSYQGAAALAAP